MKKLFTLKNCLIVVLLFAIISYLIFNIINTTDTIAEYNRLLNLWNTSLNSGNTAPSIINTIMIYRNTRNQFVTSLILNYIMLVCILFFLLLFFSKLFRKFNCLKFAFISLSFIYFALYLLQISIQFFIDYDYSNNIKRLMVAITALIALLVSISCYVYLLVREIHKRKRATQTELQEPIAEETTQH